MSESPNEKNNRKRRRRYAKDTEYRETILTDRRERYRNTRAKNLRDCSDVDAKEVKNHSTIRTMADGSRLRTVSTNQLAELIGYHHITVVRWQTLGLFPKPQLKVRGRGSMFTTTEARKIALVMAKHQKVHQYLYETDTETVRALHDAMG